VHGIIHVVSGGQADRTARSRAEPLAERQIPGRESPMGSQPRRKASRVRMNVRREIDYIVERAAQRDVRVAVTGGHRGGCS
jgi:hypothetical protein